MIIVRDIFYLKFGKAREAKELLKDTIIVLKKYDNSPTRVLTDFTGKSYRLIMESSYSDLAEYEKALNTTLGAKEWRTNYEKFVPLVQSAEREILKTAFTA